MNVSVRCPRSDGLMQCLMVSIANRLEGCPLTGDG